MNQLILSLHSSFRYIVLLLLLVAIIQSITGLFGKKPYTNTNRKINLFAMISMHIQLLIGLVLYFLSDLVRLDNIGAAMKNPIERYWTVEHFIMMLFAVVLVTIGHSRSKRINANPMYRHRAIAMFYGVALIVILLAIYQSGRPIFG